jgi:hypothetical protein
MGRVHNDIASIDERRLSISAIAFVNLMPNNEHLVIQQFAKVSDCLALMLKNDLMDIVAL